MVPLPALAGTFARITDKSAFVAAEQGKTLTSTAVRLTIAPGGQIEGRAVSSTVTGTWDRQAGYFCRTLDTATRDFPLTCQQLEPDGTTIRFTADKGTSTSTGTGTGTGGVANLRIAKPSAFHIGTNIPRGCGGVKPPPSPQNRPQKSMANPFFSQSP